MYHISYVERKISDRNFCGICFFADFLANFQNFVKFQIFSKRSIFVVQKRLLYEIAFIVTKKAMKVYLSDLINY